MVRGGDELVDDASSTNSGDRRSRPKYDGSAKAYKPWAIKAKAHFRKRAQLQFVLGATEDPKASTGHEVAGGEPEATINDREYWLFNDESGEGPMRYSAKEIVTAILKGAIKPATFRARSQDGLGFAADWVSLEAVVAYLADAGVARLLELGSLELPEPDATLDCGGGPVAIVCIGVLSRFVYTADGTAFHLRQAQVAYAPDLPHNLCSTDPLLYDYDLELREKHSALMRESDGLCLPVWRDSIGMCVLDTYSDAIAIDQAVAHSASALMVGQFGTTVTASAIVKRAVSQNTDRVLANEITALIATRKGTEKQVRNFLIWHARLGDLHPKAMALTAIHATGHSIPLNSVKISSTQLTLCDACCGGKMVRRPKPKRDAVGYVENSKGEIEEFAHSMHAGENFVHDEHAVDGKYANVIWELPDTRATRSDRVGQYITWDTWGPFKVAAHGSKGQGQVCSRVTEVTTHTLVACGCTGHARRTPRADAEVARRQITR